MSAPQKSADAAAQDAIEGRTQPGIAKQRHAEPAPSAGPHADPALVNPDATPGAGALPSPGEEDGLDSTSS
jgi:hypothetical protein